MGPIFDPTVRRGWIISLMALLALLRAIHLGAAQGTADHPVLPKIHVVIVGVPAWNVTPYQQSPLGDDIRNACLQIKSFFENSKFAGQIQFHPDDPCTKKATTYSAIRKLLFVDMRTFGKGTLTFLFMMSHGEMVKYDNELVSRDLEFITSDATDQDKEQQSLSVGTELVPWLNKMAKGSTVLAIVDTCNSGAVETLDLYLDEGLKHLLGLRFGLMASALSGNNTYAAAFTRSLLKLWGSGTCPNGKLEDWLYSKIQELVSKTLEGNDGYPDIVVPYAGGWCLSELGMEGQLLFLYQGSSRNVVWTITRTEDPGKQLPQIHTGNDPFDLSIVLPGHYKLQARTEDGKTHSFGPYDLVSQSTVPVFLEYPNNPSQAAKVLQSWADHAKFKGVPSSEIERIDGAVNFAQMAATRGAVVSMFSGSQTSTKDRSEVAARIKRASADPEKLHTLGAELLYEGDFADASMVLAKAAKESEDPRFASESTVNAYLAAGAGGDLKRAKSLRKTVAADFGALNYEVINAETVAQKERTQGALDRLKTVSIIRLLFPESPKQGILAVWEAATRKAGTPQ